MNALRYTWILLGLLASFTTGCGESLVGANCAKGYHKNGSQCVPNTDASVPDVPTDGDLSDVDTDEDSGPDTNVTSCPIGTVACEDTCIDPNSPATCGGCGGNSCSGATPVCHNGTCTNDCGPLSLCAGFCVDVDIDPNYCGNCTTSCTSNICNNGICAAQTFGHVVVIGHDYRSDTNNAEINKIIGNTVFISPSAPVRVLAYQLDALPSAIQGTDNAIDEHPGATTRNWTKTVVTDPYAVPFYLYSHNVFLIYAQPDATDAELTELGEVWEVTLGDFIRRGGVVILLESPSTNNAGTFQILEAANLFAAESRQSVPSAADRLSLVAGGDLIAGSGPSALPATFDSYQETSAFKEVASPNTTVVVEDDSTEDAVVTHMAVPPDN